MGLKPLSNIKGYWSSEWITQKTFFSDIMSRVADILDDACGK
jgi:hypothetical protein